MPVMVVTGASTGVGRAVAERFSAEGYTVCALARSVDKRAERTDLMAESESEPVSGAIHPYRLDVRDRHEVEAVFRRILSEHGRIDVLVNNAGISPAGQETTPELIDRVIDTNLKGAMYCTFAALPAMCEVGSGSVFNIASIAGVANLPAGSDGLYGASKHGLVAFSELTGKKYRRQGILITTLCPGGIDTPLWNESNPYPYDHSQIIRPEEVADLIAYILRQPRRTLFKSVVFVPVGEQW